jgi:hypothetical protein
MFDQCPYSHLTMKQNYIIQAYNIRFHSRKRANRKGAKYNALNNWNKVKIKFTEFIKNHQDMLPNSDSSIENEISYKNSSSA